MMESWVRNQIGANHSWHVAVSILSFSSSIPFYILASILINSDRHHLLLEQINPPSDCKYSSNHNNSTIHEVSFS